MKRILIATDFSLAADRAVEYGLKLADALDAAATILAVYEDIPVAVADTMSMTFIDTANARDAVEEGLRRQQGLFQQDMIQPIETLAVKGPIVGSILDTAAELDAELIVVGMKAKGKQVRKLLGSTVTALARKTRVPLLVVPEETRYQPPVSILLGDDIRPDTNIHVLDPLIEVVAVFGSKLYALRVIQKGAKEFIEILHNHTPLHDLDKTWDIKYEYQMGEDVVAALNEFTRTHAVGMVVMIPHPHSAPERWFMKSHTREMIFEAAIPLLLLPERR